MATLPELQSDLALAEEARRTLLTGKPLSRLTVGGVDYTFISLSELNKLIASLRGEISGLLGIGYGGGYNYGGFRRAT